MNKKQEYRVKTVLENHILIDKIHKNKTELYI